jgi:hypothetical protein
MLSMLFMMLLFWGFRCFSGCLWWKSISWLWFF